MRHKTFLINPEIVKQNNISIYKCIQNPGEFVIIFGGSYHAGFNMGFNCAEAVNFATKDWIDIGINAKFCKCQRDSVQIGMEDFINTLLEKKLLKKKEHEVYLNRINEIKSQQKASNQKISFISEISHEEKATDDDSGQETKKARKTKNKSKI